MVQIGEKYAKKKAADRQSAQRMASAQCCRRMSFSKANTVSEHGQLPQDVTLGSLPLCVAVTSNSTDAGLFCCVTGVAVTGNSTDAGLRCVTGRRVLG